VQEQCITKNENVLRKENIRKVGGGGAKKEVPNNILHNTLLGSSTMQSTAIAIYIVDYYYYSSYKGESAIIDSDNKHCYMPK